MTEAEPVNEATETLQDLFIHFDYYSVLGTSVRLETDNGVSLVINTKAMEAFTESGKPHLSKSAGRRFFQLSESCSYDRLYVDRSAFRGEVTDMEAWISEMNEPPRYVETAELIRHE